MTSLWNHRRRGRGGGCPPSLPFSVVGMLLLVFCAGAGVGGGVGVGVTSAFKSPFVTVGSRSGGFHVPGVSSGTRHAWSAVRATPSPTSTAAEGGTTSETVSTTTTGTSTELDPTVPAAAEEIKAKNGDVAARREPQRRTLGSQELLMLPRQYRPDSKKKKDGDDEVTFPQMTHVSVITLSATPSLSDLSTAVDEAMASHPLLRSRVEGTGEPERRIDLFQMVREGEPDPLTFVECDGFGSGDVLRVKKVPDDDDADGDDDDKRKRLYESWRPSFGDDLDGGHFDVHEGPLWSLELHKFGDSDDRSDDPCALLFTFNHAISDQSSANLLVDHILSDVANLESKSAVTPTAVRNEMPRSLEEAVLGPGETWSDVGPGGLSAGTLKYVAGKAAEGLASPVMLPDDFEANGGGGGILGALSTISGRAAGGTSSTYEDRRSALEFRSLSKDSTERLLRRCRENDVTVSNALTAAVALTSSDFIAGSGVGSGGIDGDGGDSESVGGKVKKRNYKVLQSLDKRRFGKAPDPCETVGCHAGSMDLMLGPIPDGSGGAIRSFNASRGGGGGGGGMAQFWELARESRDQTASFVESDGPTHAVRVFDFAMTQTDLNNLVHLTAQSESSQGRAYSAGVTNVGVFEKQRAVRRQKGGGGAAKQRSNLKTKHGRYQIEDIYFATPHARSGCLYQVSCMTVNGEAKFTFHPVSPLVSDETAGRFADAFVELLEIAAATTDGGRNLALPDNALSIAAALSGVAGVAVHSEAWSTFFDNVAIMRQNVADPHDFWAAMNFWIFFAVGHPILQPILWISDVLHGTPGPMVGDLVPLAFLLGNLAVVAAITLSKELRNALNIAALSAFITYVGAGLDGKAGLGDYNLQLDDDYKGQVVKGCPAYEDVRQPSMNNFDLEKYQGKWYEQKFHDWTQFKEVYDTSLDIKLTSDGKGWTDDFAVKGPAPKAAKLSWDKSPVANGAHYFLFGRVDDRDPPGVLRESGFGVEFPNYIVDVQKDPETGEYTEAIQFQCLERGGVRVFEGINFMSRAPEMTEEQLQAMHQRAENAGMNPYGAAEEQMHRVERRPVDSPDVDNAWQAMWRSIGVDKLLELLTESIEDGGR